ncbi:MAG: DUF3343 domain-containing protein [Chitinispirillaceae bacterium]|nr:DUF3343 domain-containing protein [Chitinispirillaceae bacterium]
MAGHCIVTFFGTSSVLRAEKSLKQERIAVETIAAPRYISSECGICIRISAADEERVRALLSSVSIETQGYYHE